MDQVDLKPLAYRIDDLTKVLGIGRTTIYELLKQGKLKAIKIAGRTLVTAIEVQRLIAEAESVK